MAFNETAFKERFRKRKRYLIRDIETKKPLRRFNKEVCFTSKWQCIQYFKEMKWGLNMYYEIYDRKKDEVVYYEK